MTTETVSVITDVSGYDFPTLVKWFIDLRNHKSEVKRSIEPAIAQVEQQMEAIEKEFHKRITASGVTALKTEYGTVSRSIKTKYSVDDAFAFRQWVAENPQEASRLINASITQSEMAVFIAEEGNKLPDGVRSDSTYELSIRRK